MDSVVAEARTRAATLDVVVLGGAGHVGLPLSLVLAASGLTVGIFDISAASLDKIARSEMPFVENGADELLANVLSTGRLELGSSPDMLARAKAVVIVVGTPIDEFLNPSFTIFQKTVDQVAPYLEPGTLVILRSTVFPGTTEYVAAEFAKRGCKIDLAFCPERIAEGHALEELSGLPQIIGADEQVAGDRAEALFRNITTHIVRTCAKEAELAKLFTNAWRYIKFATANQFFEIAHEAGVDYSRILRAIKTDYPRAADLPGPGLAAGPCLLKDTMQLAAFTSDHFAIGQSAMQVNEGLPAFIVDGMRKRFGSLRGRSVGLLGMAFKAESDDIRSSLSYKLRKLLLWEGANVLCTDPYVNDPRLLPLEKVLTEAEILVMGVPHRVYRQAGLADRDIVDIWGSLGDIRL